MQRPDLPLEQLLSVAIESRLLDVHTATPGIVVAYDATKKRADIRPAVKRGLRGIDERMTHERVPVLPNVPVAWLAAGGFELHFPLAAGDAGWLLFSEVATSAYYQTGEVSDAGDAERFGLSSPLFLPCRRTASTAVGANLVAPTPFTVGTPATAQFVALANLVLVELNKIKTAFDTHTHPVPGIAAGVASTTSSAPGSPMPAMASVASAKLKSD